MRKGAGRTVEARYLAEHKDYSEDSSRLQAEREDSEFNNLEEIPGNAERFICAMDFFTVGSVLGKRFYVFAAISHKTLEIFQFAITENLAREFLRQQLMLFTESIATRAYLIHDNALMFNIGNLAYNLVPIRTGGVEAPKMNSIMERFFRTVRRGALDNYLLTGKNQVQRILDEYVAFYNGQRPDQGIQQQIPKTGQPEKIGGPVCMSPVLGGLHHHYYRHAA